MRHEDPTEAGRLTALAASELWDAPAGAAWRALAEHMRLALDAPLAGVSLVGRTTVRWLALAGADAGPETPRRNSFCHGVVVAGDLVKIMAWYDNEWGYAAQMVREAARQNRNRDRRR